MPIGSARAARTATATALTGFGIFQACLAGGAPWGRFAYGGQHDGRLPARYRRVSAAAAPLYGAAAAFVASGAGRAAVRRRVLSGLAGYMVLGAGLNLASRSPRERLWSPVCALTAVAAWRARP